MKELSSVNETKPKSIIINGDLHNRFKMLCKGKNLKIGGVIEDLIVTYLHDPNGMERVINSVKDDINEVERKIRVNKLLSDSLK